MSKNKHTLFVEPSNQFLGTLEALREIIETTPELGDHDNPQITKPITSAFKHIPPSKKGALKDAVDALRTVLDHAVADSKQNGGPASDGNSGSPSNDLDIKSASGAVKAIQKPPTNGDSENPEYTIQVSDADVGEALIDMIANLARRASQPPRHHLVLSSLLVSAVSAFEVLVTQLATAYFRLHPDAVDGSEKEFSLNDLKALSSIENAIEVAIERQVESIGRGLIEWEKWFSKRLNIEFSKACINWETVQELFQRRHIIVHNGGRVSKQYLDKLPKTPHSPKVGNKLPATKEYVTESLIQLAAFGATLSLATWSKLCPGDGGEIAARQIELGRHFAETEDWRSVLAVSRTAGKSKFPTADQIEIDCNRWLAQKQIEGAEAIRPLIEQWDVSALQSIYKLYKLCLLNNVEGALQLVPELLEAEELTITRLRKMPIFRSLCAHPKFEETIAAHTQASPNVT